MKTLLMIFLLLTSSMAWANPLTLECVMNHQTTRIDVESLVSNGCQSKTVPMLNGQIKTRYNITLCDGDRAEGTVEALNSRGEWLQIDEFSTDHECSLFRKISSSKRCRGFGHNCL